MSSSKPFISEVMVRQVCAKAATLIQTGWCQGVHARSSNLIWVAPELSSATSWSARGAIKRAIAETDGITAKTELYTVIVGRFESVVKDNIDSYNDNVKEKKDIYVTFNKLIEYSLRMDADHQVKRIGRIAPYNNNLPPFIAALPPGTPITTPIKPQNDVKGTGYDELVSSWDE